jgi:membrane protein DedA with SNARE-associated domain
MELVTYVGLFAAVVATWAAVSGPGEAALVGAGTIAGRDEQIGVVLLVAFAGTLAGSVAAYWIGRAAGRSLLLGPGPFLRWRTRALARSESLARRRQFLAALLTPGWFAGINEISLRPFLAGVALSGLAWTLFIGLGAAYVGPSLIAAFDEAGRWATIAALLAGGAAALILLARRRLSHG